MTIFVTASCRKSKNRTPQKKKPNTISTIDQRIKVQQDKIAEIQALKVKLEAKSKKYNGTIKKFLAKIATARDEINTHIETTGETSLESAKNNAVIVNNLTMIQRADAYIDVFTTEIMLIEKSKNEVDKLEKIAGVDLIAIDSLDNNEEFDKLLAQINLMIKDVQPQADKAMVGKDLVKEKSLDEIWKKHILNSKRKKSQAKKNGEHSNLYFYDKSQKPIDEIEWNKSGTVIASRSAGRITFGMAEGSGREWSMIVEAKNVKYVDMAWQSDSILAVTYYNISQVHKNLKNELFYNRGIHLINRKTGKIVADINYRLRKEQDKKLQIINITKDYIVTKTSDSGFEIRDIEGKRVPFKHRTQNMRFLPDVDGENGRIVVIYKRHFDVYKFSKMKVSDKREFHYCKQFQCAPGFEIQDISWNMRFKTWIISAKSKKGSPIISWYDDNPKNAQIARSRYNQTAIPTPKQDFLFFTETERKSTLLNVDDMLKKRRHRIVKMPKGTTPYIHPTRNYAAYIENNRIVLVDIATMKTRRIPLSIKAKHKFITAKWSSTGDYFAIADDSGRVHICKNLVESTR